MKKYAIAILFVVTAFVCGWYGARRFYGHFVAIPTGNTRLEVPNGCEPRLWMNGVELDCKDGAMIYYANKLARKSP